MTNTGTTRVGTGQDVVMSSIQSCGGYLDSRPTVGLHVASDDSEQCGVVGRRDLSCLGTSLRDGERARSSETGSGQDKPSDLRWWEGG